MKKIVLIPIALLFLFTLACNVGGIAETVGISNKEVVPTETNVPLIIPTETPPTIPTAEPTNTLPPRPTATNTQQQAQPTVDSGPHYFVEEFDGGSGSWIFEYITGNTQNQCNGPQFINGELNWSCPAGEETYVSIYNLDNEYSDVVLLTETRNMGVNNHRVALMCRVNDMGWYEFRFASNGYFEFYRFDWALKNAGKTPYVFLGEGITNLISPSRETNQVAMECNGSDFKFYANGNMIDFEVAPARQAELQRTDPGGIGVGYFILPDTPGPVDVSFLWLETRAP